MKNIISKIILVFLVSIGLLGCNGFLEEDNFSRIPVNQFFEDLDQAEAALLGVYAAMGDEDIGVGGSGFGNVGTWYRGNDWMLATNTDETVIQQQGTNGVAWTPLTTFSYLPENFQVRATWIGMYEGIYRANLVIQNVEGIAAIANEDINRKKGIIAEARFMRGFYHFYLMCLYGGVPIIDAPTQETSLVRNSVQEMANFITEDFLYAIDNIQSDKMGANGRAGKFSAAAYLAKLHLYLASCKENNVSNGIDNFAINSFDWVDATDHYQKAANYTDMIYGNYSLIQDYRLLFMKVGESQSRNEFIFNIEFSDLYPARHQRTFMARGASARGGGNGHVRPNHQMLTIYDTGDRRITNLQRRALQPPTESINGVLHHIVDQATRTTANNQFFIAKWRKPSYQSGEEPEANRTVSNINYPLIRYADVLLMRAEAHFKLTGSRVGIPDDMLTEVRQRSATGTDVNALNAAYLKADFMEEMMEERSRELCFEGWRRIDLIRTNTYASSIQALDLTQTAPNLRNRVTEMKTNFELYKMWYPIPQVEISLAPNLVQNPGYSGN